MRRSSRARARKTINSAALTSVVTLLRAAARFMA
jgi:hypothetical protein